MGDGRFPVEVVSGVPVVAAPEKIDITKASELQSACCRPLHTGTGHSWPT